MVFSLTKYCGMLGKPLVLSLLFFLAGCASSDRSINDYKWESLEGWLKSKQYSPVNNNVANQKLGKENEGHIISENNKKYSIDSMDPLIGSQIPGLEQRLSISVTPDSNISSIIKSLAEIGEFSVVIQGNFQSLATINIKKRCIRSILQELALANNLRYAVQDSTIIVQPDSCYSVTYNLPFISMKRSFTSSMLIPRELSNLKSDEVSSTSSKDNDLKEEFNADFWQELQKNLQVVIDNCNKLFNPHIIKDKATCNFVITQHTGAITVHCSRKGHKLVEQFIKTVAKALTAQVTIEAKVLEIQLNNRFKSGIDWSLFNKFKMKAGSSGYGDFAHLLVDGDHFSILLSMLETFGSVKTLSSPRVSVLNNQVALLKVAENFVYFNSKLQFNHNVYKNHKSKSKTLLPEMEYINEIKTVPVGIIVSLQPSINLERGEVTLSMRPSITKVVRTANMPKLLDGDTTNNIVPVVEVREINSLIKLKNGEAAVLGGLIQEQDNNAYSGLPQGHKWSFFSSLAGQKQRESTRSELVIIIKANIINEDAQ